MLGCRASRRKRLDGHRGEGARERSRSPDRHGHDGYLQTLQELDRENRQRLADAFLTGRASRQEGRLGTRDAGRAFWLHLRGILCDAYWRESALESALFYYVLNGRVRGIMITHVDDLRYNYYEDCKSVRQSVEQIKEKVKLTMEEVPFVSCGKKAEQTDDGTTVSIWRTRPER